MLILSRCMIYIYILVLSFTHSRPLVFSLSFSLSLSFLVTVPDVPVLAGSSGIIVSSVTYGSASYKLDWTAPSNTGGSPITSYTVTCTSGTIGTISGTNPITSTITNLAGGVPVTCTVKANNAQGASNGVTTNSFTPGINIGQKRQNRTEQYRTTNKEQNKEKKRKENKREERRRKEKKRTKKK